MSNLLLILLCLALGLGLRRLPRFPADAAGVLNAYVIHAALPAVILTQMHRLRFSADLLLPALMPWAMLALAWVLVLAAARVWRWSRAETGALLLMTGLGNTSFLGFPLVEAWFGPQGLRYAVIYDQLGSFFALTLFGSYVLAHYGAAERPTALGLLRRIAAFPPFIALALGLALAGWDWPEALGSALQRLGDSLVPVVMVAVGLQWRLRLPASGLPKLGFALSLKLILAPLAAWGLCRLLGLDGEAMRVTVFEAGMPAMISAGALAIAAGLAPELCAAIVGYGILLSFATTALLHGLL
ncbi:MAG: AEC family transporter [Gammaproteobacteria bacterium]|nr:AEC family transporter [Gammaproteobacteria bacterium]